MVRVLFLMIAGLNGLDAVLTLAGLHYKLITEANPIMRKLYDIHPAVFTSAKLSFSLFLMVFVAAGRVPSSLIIKVLSTAAVILYWGVILAHVYWIRLLVG